jgi:hypothetical protein
MYDISRLRVNTMSKCHLRKAVANVSCFQALHNMLASNFAGVYDVDSGAF